MVDRLAEIMEVVMTRQTRRRSEVALRTQGSSDGVPKRAMLGQRPLLLGRGAQRRRGRRGCAQRVERPCAGAAGRPGNARVDTSVSTRREFGDARRLLEENRGSIRSYARLKADVSWSAGRLSDAVDLYLEGKENASRGPDLGEMALCDASIACAEPFQVTW